MTERVPACIWPVTAEVIVALDDHLGDPDDAYVNGAQVWIRDNGPGGARLEWRLHPVPGFIRPAGVGVHDLWDAVVYALRVDEEPPADPLSLWDGLEAFPGFGDEVEPVPLAATCTAVLGVAPEAFGVVDHDRIGDEWERTGGACSVLTALRAQLAG
ncbi:MAG: hypothetical protein ACKO91_10360 [Acidimicrobiales bacterium]